MMRMMVNKTSITRRALLGGLVATGVLGLVPSRVLAAVSQEKATSLIKKVVSEITKIINSGKAEPSLIIDFEKVFTKYADVNFIAMAALGSDGRSASKSDKRAFVKAFSTYLSRRYGSQFRKFEGGKVQVIGTQKVKTRFEVLTKSTFKGEAPFDVIFVVSEKNGKFIDMKVEGISIVKSERKEIGSMLDRRKGDLSKLIADLNAS